MTTDTILLDSVNDPERVEAKLGGGTLCAFSAPAPEKTTGNEDCVAAIPYGPNAVILVVADGAGGLPGGRKASYTAVASLQTSLNNAMNETMLLRTAILNGIDAANQAVLATGTGSATTMTVVTIEGKVARSYQIGDSKSMIVGQRGRVRAITVTRYTMKNVILCRILLAPTRCESTWDRNSNLIREIPSCWRVTV